MATHRLEFPHAFDKLACPNCGHQATKAPLLHPETGEHIEHGDQFHIHGLETDNLLAIPAMIDNLFKQPPEDIKVACPKCEHHAHGREFGLHHHDTEVA